MKKISLKGISEILSERELKNVIGGGSETAACLLNCALGTPCFFNGKQGTCLAVSISSNCTCVIF